MSNLGDDLVEAMGEVVAYVQGDVGKTRTHVVEVPNVDVADIRKQTGLSRPKFAARFGLDPRAVQDWEQGRRRPDRAARVLLRIIEQNPEVVAKAAVPT